MISPAWAQQPVNQGNQQPPQHGVEQQQQQQPQQPAAQVQTGQLPPTTREPGSAEMQIQQTIEAQREEQARRDQMQREVATTGSLQEPAGAQRGTANWGWLGLLGLLGLRGLMRRRNVYDDRYRPLRSE
ncbi:MAG: hypothetical protein ACK4UN_04210 [Limisphaerales bacterium]